MIVIGYAASILIGVSLGLIGGGGSILTVPVLVYLFQTGPVEATAYSLFIVGIASAIGSVAYFRMKQVDIRTAVIFGIPSIAAVFATRAWLIPAIPEHLFDLGSFDVSKNMMIMVLFAVLMLVASISMIKKEKPKPDTDENKPRKFNYPMIFAEGAVVGTLTGMVGAGGGFLIIPALVILSGLPMKKAIGTSLVIIAAKSLIGFTAENEATQIDWELLRNVTLFAVAGIFAGIYLSKKIDSRVLKPAFGWFVLVMGTYILLKETIFANY